MASAQGDGPGRAAGNRFPTALRGYEASAVDAHIGALEGRLALLADQSMVISERVTHLEEALAAVVARLGGAVERGAPGRTEYEVQRLEAMTQSISAVLQSAHDEAASVRERAEAEAEAILREAEALLADAERSARTAAARAGMAEPAADALAP